MGQQRADVLGEHSASVLRAIGELARFEGTSATAVELATSTVILLDDDNVDLRIRVLFGSECRWVGVLGSALETDTPRWHAELTGTEC